jgi:hypothetical protein
LYAAQYARKDAAAKSSIKGVLHGAGFDHHRGAGPDPVLPVLLGPKACRKAGVGAVLQELRAQIPDNGVGPVIAERRGAVAFLEENCRQCGRCRLGRDI